MLQFIPALLGTLLCMTVSIQLALPGASSRDSRPADFAVFQNNYLLVYSLAMAGDWLQGPYIYALYEHYGYTVGDIGILFVAGFASSMVFGTLAGALADKYGRRLASLAYMVIYSLSCLTKHSGNFWMLMVGRLLGGIATSLLFSAFESWLVAEHVSRSFSDVLLGDVFSKASFLGGGLMAILSGLVGNVLVEDMKLGPVASFDAAVVIMVLGACAIALTWTENYGDSSEHSLTSQFQAAAAAIAKDQRVALLGAMQAMFEGSMFTFVFLWTPALSPQGEKVPHGIIFSCFMTACMLGSALTGKLLKSMSPHRYMPLVYLLASASLTVPFMFHLEHRPALTGSSLGSGPQQASISLQGKLQLVAFCLFEACVGMFWPSMMALRALYLPEETRSTIINLFRIPLNMFVCLVLCKVSDFPLSVMFGLCILLLGACVLCQLRLNQLTCSTGSGPGHVAADGAAHSGASTATGHVDSSKARPSASRARMATSPAH